MVNNPSIEKDISVKLKLIKSELANEKKKSALLQTKLSEAEEKIQLKDSALQEILGQIEIIKKNIYEQLISSLDTFVTPLIQKLEQRMNPEDKMYTQLIIKSLYDLTILKSGRYKWLLSKLTLREFEVANMIKNGLSASDVARTLNISLDAVKFHKKNIRKKFGLVNEKVKLPLILKNLEEASEQLFNVK